MKALTLWQPWASLVALGKKSVETRCWSTPYRGELAIHSAKLMPPRWLGASRETHQFRLQYGIAMAVLPDLVGHHFTKLPRGTVLCIVKLVDVVPVERVRDELSEMERAFGNYEDGRFAWFTEMVEAFDEPIVAKGNRMLWNWSGVTR